MALTSENILKLIAIRSAILKANGHSQEEIEKDIEGYVGYLNDPSKLIDPKGFERFVEGQFMVYERTRGQW